MLEAVTLEERALLNGLRDIPGGAAWDELMALLMDLVGYVRDPHCPRAQGDGVPCTTVSLPCEDCQQVRHVLATLRQSRWHV